MLLRFFSLRQIFHIRPLPEVRQHLQYRLVFPAAAHYFLPVFYYQPRSIYV